MERRVLLVCLVVSLGFAGCTGSDDTDDETPSIGRIDEPAVVDPSFDPFATDPSTPPVNPRD